MWASERVGSGIDLSPPHNHNRPSPRLEPAQWLNTGGRDWNKNIKNIPRDGSSGMFPICYCRLCRNMPKACPYAMMQFAPSASEMPHYAKHHASENRRAIERSLVTRARWGTSLGEGRLWLLRIGWYHDRPSPRLILCAHCYHQATRPCAQGRLHGVSHHLASPMPAPAVVSVFP